MIANPLIKLLLWPFSLVYGISIGIRNALYEVDLLKSARFGLPIISIGNLSVGGAGKTPHVEYLINLLQPYINIGVLSRGYNRSSKGFRFVHQDDSALEAGDEPLMYAKKYQDVVVAVCESRATGIPEMVKRFADLETIILDDAFQHRSVLPDINMLLTSFDNLYINDCLLPMGRLREKKSSSERADIIIVTKVPLDLSYEEAMKIKTQIAPLDYQSVYFTKYRYGNPYSFYETNRTLDLKKIRAVILVTAIANTSYLMSYLDQFNADIKSLAYEDHRYFTEYDIKNIIDTYKSVSDEQGKIILTTEKDATRLAIHYNTLIKERINVFVLPITVDFLFNQKEDFNKEIKDRLLEIDK
ncbi:MAG TPA: tetraacyldisaccharide 4'-kinase [Saprospiraceae bacterium]|nr:tetraacyldisaccharide 4'-kinase [Saprospiraceae bacterium]